MVKKASQSQERKDGGFDVVEAGVSITGILIWCAVCVVVLAGVVGVIVALARRSLLKKCGGNRVLAKHGSLIF